MARRHPVEALFGRGLILGAVTYVLARYIVRPMFRAMHHLAWRWRRGLAPLWFSFGCFLVAVIWRGYGGGLWYLAFVLPVLGLVLAVLGPRLSGAMKRAAMFFVPDSIDAGRKGVLDRPSERIYLAVLLSYVGGWIALRVHWGPSDLSLYTFWLGTTGIGGTWWYHRRVRVSGRADRYARRWKNIADPDKSKIKPLHRSAVASAAGARSTARLRIRLDPGVIAADVSGCEDSIASFYGLRSGAVFMSRDERSARHVWLTFLPKDPWKGKISHPMPEPGSISIAERGAVFDMGLLANGKPATYRLQHTFACGASGSGKSGWIESLLTWLTACSDVVIVGSDLAAGATLGVWRKCLALPLAEDYDSTVHLLERVYAMIRYREGQLGINKEHDDEAEDSFSPSVATPWLVVVIDEFPDFVAEAMTMGKLGKDHLLLLGRIAKKARKAGVWLILAAQNGSKADTGSKELQTQLRAIVGLGLEPHASKVLWGELQKQGWTSTGLRQGQYLLRDDEHTSPDVAKGYFVEIKERRAHIRAAAEHRPILEPDAWAALMGTSALVADPPADESTVIEHEPRAIERAPSEEDPIIGALAAGGPARAAELIETTGISKATMHRKLRAHADAGRVRSRSGVWELVDA